MSDKPHGAGRSSIDLVDIDEVFNRILIDSEMVLLDLGCGAGNYSLAAAERLSGASRVIGVDLWPGGIEILRREAGNRGHANIRAIQANAAGPRCRLRTTAWTSC